MTLRNGPALFAGLAFALLLIAGCGRNKHQVELDPRFSINLVRTPDWFPPPDVPLGPAEADVIARKGKPDFIRFWWRDDGSLITSSDLSGRRDRIGQEMQVMQRSWLYTRAQEEVVFLNSGQSYSVQPMSEIIKLIARYGDPSFRSPPLVKNGRVHETWQWIDYGLQLEMIDGVPGRETRFPATGSGTYLAK